MEPKTNGNFTESGQTTEDRVSRVCAPGTTYDVHVASDVVSDDADRLLASMGFVRDAFIGGTTGVVHPCHYSAHPPSRAQMAELWQRALGLLSAFGPQEFYGYAEAEVTPPQFRAS